MNTKKLIISLFLACTAPRVVIGAGGILSAMEPIDLSKIAGTSNLLLVGDDHTQPAIKDFLKDHLDSLKKLGFKSLALEMIPSNLQSELDSWAPDDREKIRKHLDVYWGDKGPGVVDALMGLIEAAHNEDIAVIALECPNAANLSRTEVNPYWAERLEGVLERDKTAKIVVFCGSMHLESVPGSLYSILHDKGFSPSVIDFSGLEKEKSLATEVEIDQILGKSIRKATRVGLAAFRSDIHGNFMVKQEKVEKDGTYWIVNLNGESVQYAAAF